MFLSPSEIQLIFNVFWIVAISEKKSFICRLYLNNLFFLSFIFFFYHLQRRTKKKKPTNTIRKHHEFRSNFVGALLVVNNAVVAVTYWNWLTLDYKTKLESKNERKKLNLMWRMIDNEI